MLDFAYAMCINVNASARITASTGVAENAVRCHALDRLATKNVDDVSSVNTSAMVIVENRASIVYPAERKNCQMKFGTNWIKISDVLPSFKWNAVT